MKKKIVCTIFCLMLIFIGNNAYASGANATCIYEGTTATYTFLVTTNSNGSITYKVSDEQKNNVGNYMTYNVDTKNIASNNFYDSSTNKIVCSANLYYKLSGGGTNVNITLNFVDFDEAAAEPIKLSDKSVINNATLEPENAIIKSCSYDGKNVYGTVVSKVTIILTKNGISYELTNDYLLSPVDENIINTINFTKDTNCSNFLIHVTCGNSGNNKYCTIKGDEDMPGTGTSGTETPDAEDLKPESGAEYTCSYIGKINGQNLKISKFETEWKVTYPNGTTEDFDTNRIKGNVFPSSNCDDIFYITDEKIVKAVENNSTYQDINIAQYCRSYENVEQFCQNGTCKIENALCGNTLDNENEYGECPSELKPIIIFLKRVVFNVIQYMVPILLILMGSIDLVRAVIASDDKAMKDAVSKLVKRILTAGLLFFVTLIVTVVMDLLADVPNINDATGWKACWHNID